MEQLVNIFNIADEDFTAKYDGAYLTIPAGESKTFPWDVMVVWMGDPEMRNTPEDQIRDKVYRKLCSFHNARGHLGNEPELLPQLEAYNLDGDRIITVLDDPDGESIVPDADEATDIGALQRQIERLEAMMDRRMAGLEDTPRGDGPVSGPGARSAAGEGVKAAARQAERDEMSGVEPEPDGADDGVDVPEDAPSKTPVGQSKRSGPTAVRKPAPKRTAKKASTKPPGSRSAGTAGRRAASTS